MKARLSAVLILLSSLAFADPAPVVVQGAHYTVTSWAGPEAAQTTLAVMEALVERYNSLFLFDLSKNPAPWAVHLYASKADFDAALAGVLPSIPNDYVYLYYSDPAKSHLAAWVPSDGAPADEVRSLAFQGFFQFLWTYVPHPPAWIETGLASVFWNSQWDGTTLSASPDLPFLETLQERWKDRAPDLKALLQAPAGSFDPETGRDLEAWALAAFLLESPDPTYSRLFGSALANLSANASEEANREAVIQRFQAAKDWNKAASDLVAYWKGKQGFRTKLDQGITALKNKDLAGAASAFQAALTLRPHDDAALYYAGLAAYEAKDYESAERHYARISPKALAPGVVAYARGLAAFAQKQLEPAKTWLLAAQSEDEATYGPLVAPMLAMVR